LNGDEIVLEAGEARVVISREGAEPRSWSIAGQELLWNGDPTWWPRSCPILFPVVGWTRGGQISVDGVSYPMGVHGFAATSRFSLDAQGEAEVRLSLCDDTATRDAFPFPFHLAVTYSLSGTSLSAFFSVTNPGPSTLPYALGLHPGFRWSAAGVADERHAVVFEQEEEAQVPEIAPGGLFRHCRRRVPFQGRRLPLAPDLFAHDALCFLNARSRSVRLEMGRDGCIEVAARGFPHIALWSKPGAPFLCIESWTGHGDPEDFSGDLADKPSMRLLSPGATAEHAVTFSFHRPAGG
jgi:galactose mutarotase-like enzyme